MAKGEWAEHSVREVEVQIGFPSTPKQPAARARLRPVPPTPLLPEELPSGTERSLVASFDREDGLIAALRDLRANGFEIADVYTPYAIHGLETEAGFAPTRLGWVTAGAGFTGAAAMLAFQSWTSATDWAIDVGGKPFNSIPAFIPAVFEIGVLCAGLGTVLAFFMRSRLYPGRTPELPAAGVTNDRFVIVLEERDSSFDGMLAGSICQRHGALTVDERTDGRAR